VASPVILNGNEQTPVRPNFHQSRSLAFNAIPFSELRAAFGTTDWKSEALVGIVTILINRKFNSWTSEAQIQDEAPAADISGLCARDRDGAGLKWAVYGDQDTRSPLAVGTSHWITASSR